MKRTKTFLVFFGLVIGLCGVAVIAANLFLAPMVQRLLVKTVRTELGLEVTVEKISGTYFRDLKLTGLRTVKPAEAGMLVSIEAVTIHAYYSLPLLLKSKDAFFSRLRLELDGARVAMDFSRGGNGGGGEELPPAPTLILPMIQGRDCVVDLRGSNWALALSDVDLTMAAFDYGLGGFPLMIHAAESAVELPFMRRQTPELAARGVLARYTVRVDGLEVNGRPTFKTARFEYGPGEPVRCAASFTAFDGSGEIRAVFAGNSTEFEWNIREVNISSSVSLLTLKGPLPGGRITSSGKLAGDFADPGSLAGSVSLTVADGSVRDIPFNRVALTGSAAGGGLRIDSFQAEAGRNTVSASGVSASLKALVAGDADQMLRSTRGRFSARLEDIPALLAMAGISTPRQHFSVGIPSHRLVLAGRASDDGIILESGTFSGGGGTVTVERFTATLPRTGPLRTGLSLSARLSANITDLGRTAAIFGVDTAGGRLRAEVTFEGPLQDIKGDIELHGRDLRYRAGGIDTLHLVARSGPQGWRIANLEAARGEDRLTGSGGIAMKPVTFNKVVLDLTLRDFHPYLGWFMTGEMPAAHGRLDAHLELSGPPTMPKAGFRAVLTDATVENVTVARGELTGTMAGEVIDVTSLKVRMPEGQVEIAGSFRHRAWGVPISGTIARLTLAGEENDLLRLLEPVTVKVGGKTSWSFTTATLQGDAGTFHLGGGVTRAGCNISFRLDEVRSAPLHTLYPELPLEFSGLNLEGSVSGALTAPDVAFAGSVAEVRPPDAFVPLSGQFDVRFASGGIVLKTFSWTTTAGDRIKLAGTIPYDPYGQRFIPDKLAVDGVFSVPDLGTFTAFLPEKFRMPGALKGTLKISGTGERPQVAIDFHAKDVRFPASVPVAPPGPVSVDAVAVLENNDLRVDTLTVSGSEFNISVSGKWYDMGDVLKRRPAAGLPGSLDLRGDLSVADMSRLTRGLPGIRRLGGKVEGTLAALGRASEPDISGQLSLENGEFRVEGAIPPLRDIQARLVFEQRTATIEQFTGTVGGSRFVVDGSVILPMDGEPEADLRMQGANLLLYRSEDIGIRGDADMTIKGMFSAPAFAGTVAITDGRLRKNINWLASLRDIGRSKAPVVAGPAGIGFSFHKPPMKDATFAVHVTSKGPFRIKSNVARGELRPDLWLRGTGEIPLITGVVYIDSSRLLLPAGRLSIRSGLIRFPENSPGRPLLEVSGSSRILGYDINMTVEGRYDEPTVSLSSVPPLPQDALLLLLLTGKLPPGVAEQSGAWQGGVTVALYVGKGVLEEWFGSDLESDESLLDRFDVVIGRGISRQGNETIGAQYRLADGVVREGDELYLVAERDIYDEFNTGVRIVFRFK